MLGPIGTLGLRVFKGVVFCLEQPVQTIQNSCFVWKSPSRQVEPLPNGHSKCKAHIHNHTRRAILHPVSTHMVTGSNRGIDSWILKEQRTLSLLTIMNELSRCGESPRQKKLDLNQSITNTLMNYHVSLKSHLASPHLLWEGNSSQDKGQ